MLKQEKKKYIKQKLKKAFFFWFYFEPLSFHFFKNSQKKTQTKTALKQKIKYFKEFSINSTFKLLNNNQQIKQKELFLLKQFLTNLEIQANAIRHLDSYNLKTFFKTKSLSFKKRKEESKFLQSLYFLEDFLNV
jgi:hypothetical protein